MSQNKFINLEELSKTTQALLIKINEQSNLKVNKSSVSANFDTGTKIGSIDGIDFYTPSINADSLSSILAPVALSNDYWDLDSTPKSLSSFTNDVGYITSYTETDPTVPAWAKASQKPTYTAAEVGALPDSTVIPEDKVFIATYNSTTFADTVTAYNAGKLIFAVYTGDSANGKLILPLTRYIGTFFQFEGKYLNGRSSKITLYLRSSGEWSSESIQGDSVTRNATISPGDSFIIRDSDSSGVMKYSSLIFGSSTDQYLANDGTWQSLNKIQTAAGDNNIEFDLIGTAPTNTNSEAVSVYKPTLITFAKTNEFGRLTLGSSTIPGVIRLYSSTTNATGYTDLKSGSSSTNTRTITFPDADGTVALTNDIPNVPSWALATNKPTYTASEVGAATTSDVSSMISSAVSGITSFSTEVVQTLPATGVTGRFYFVPNNVGTNNIYEEYIYVNNTWEKLGNFDASNIDLSGYVQKQSGNNGTLYSNYIGTLIQNDNGILYLGHLDDIEEAEAGIHLNEDGLDLFGMPDKNKPVTIRGLATPSENYDAANKEYVDTVAANAGVTSFNGQSGAITYVPPVTSVNGNTGAVTLNIPSTASDINAAADTHNHGYLNTDGTFSSQMPIASNDCLIISDDSNSNKLARSTLAFGSSTTKYLANNGTWQDIPTSLPASDVSNWAKASTKPTYTANEVGAAASNHTHSSIFTTAGGGDAQARVTTDSSYSKVSFSNSFGSSSITTALGTITLVTQTTDPAQTNTLTISGGQISGLATPTTDTMAANKAYVDNRVAKTGDTMTGSLVFYNTNADYGANITLSPSIRRDTMGEYGGYLLVDGRISTNTTPAYDNDITNKAYVDNAIPKPYNATTNPNGYLTMANLPLYDGTVE